MTDIPASETSTGETTEHVRAQGKARTAYARGCSPLTLMGCGCGLLAMIGILLIFLLLGVTYIRSRTDPRWDETAFNTCMDHMRYLSAALASYEKDHHRLPETLQELSPRYLDSAARLRCPLETRGLGEPYHYYPRVTAPGDPMLVCGNHGQCKLFIFRNGKMVVPGKDIHQKGGWR